MITENEFVSLVQENEKILYKIASLYADGDQNQEDLRQEMLLQMWKSIRGFKGHSVFTTWMYRVALNVALNYRRSLAKSKTDLVEDMSHYKTLLSEKKDYEVLYFIIKRLPETDRMIISLHLDGYRNPEIAEIVGVTTNHLNVKIHRIKDNISKLYKSVSDGHQ